jgi:hypothetical protein
MTADMNLQKIPVKIVPKKLVSHTFSWGSKQNSTPSPLSCSFSLFGSQGRIFKFMQLPRA